MDTNHHIVNSKIIRSLKFYIKSKYYVQISIKYKCFMVTMVGISLAQYEIV